MKNKTDKIRILIMDINGKLTYIKVYIKILETLYPKKNYGAKFI